MSEIDQILAQLPMDQLAAQLGVDENEAEDAARTALPALLGGLQANAADPAGALSLGQALQNHDGSLLGSDLDAIDTADGSKIVQNIFGNNTDAVISQLGGVRGGNSSLISKLLPMLAPIVLAYLGKKLQQQGGLGDILGQVLGGGSSSSPAQQPRSGGYQQEQPSGPPIPTDGSSTPDISLGDGPTQSQETGSSNPMGGVLGDILGQVLGGGGAGASGRSSGGSSSRRSSSPDAGSIIDVLGGLLGGGRR